MCRREWLQVLIFSSAIMLITSLPYLYGASLSTPALQFGGFVIGVEDGNSYLAKMRLGATDGWQFHLFYTSEPHQGAYLFTFHLLLGKIARLSGLSLTLVYHLARIACGVFLLVSIYRFISYFTNLKPVRQLAFWMVAVGGGLGWLVALLGLLDRLGLPLDFYSPEAFIFHGLFALPHLSLAMGLMLWGILLLLTAWERLELPYALLAGLALLAMTAIGAFYIAIPAAVMGITWVWRWGTTPPEERHTWKEAGLAAVAFAIGAPVLFYNAYVFSTNPVFKVWAEQNRILSPAPVHYLLAFGPLALLAAVGVRKEWQLCLGHSLPWRRLRLLIAWCAVVPLLVYFPFNLQRRLALGFQVALAIWAALGLWSLAGSGSRPRGWRAASIAIVGLLSVTNVLLVAGAMLGVSRQSPPLFHSAAEISAADWLGVHASSDQVVLAGFETGNYLPTRMSARVFAGHGPETAHADEKLAELLQFFGNSSDDFRRSLLRDYGIDYVYYGPAERALSGFSPADVPYLQPVYDNGPVQIYQVLDLDDG